MAGEMGGAEQELKLMTCSAYTAPWALSTGTLKTETSPDIKKLKSPVSPSPQTSLTPESLLCC